MEDVYLKNLDMAELIEKARHAVMTKAAQILTQVRAEGPSAGMATVLAGAGGACASMHSMGKGQDGAERGGAGTLPAGRCSGREDPRRPWPT